MKEIDAFKIILNYIMILNDINEYEMLRDNLRSPFFNIAGKN